MFELFLSSRDYSAPLPSEVKVLGFSVQYLMGVSAVLVRTGQCRAPAVSHGHSSLPGWPLIEGWGHTLQQHSAHFLELCDCFGVCYQTRTF